MSAHGEDFEPLTRTSLAERAYEEIRALVLDGRIPPGSRLTVRPIADQLQLSATPVKAALVMLEREGLIVSHLHRGFFVPKLSDTDMREIYELREALDGAASRLTAERDEGAAATALAAACDAQADYLDAHDIDGYRHTDVEFHRLLWQACGNTRIQRVGEPLLDQMLLSNALSARQPGRGYASLDERRGIVDAIRAGDPELAAARAQQHVRHSYTSFVQAVSKP